jgi:hypothetical protein
MQASVEVSTEDRARDPPRKMAADRDPLLRYEPPLFRDDGTRLETLGSREPGASPMTNGHRDVAPCNAGLSAAARTA